MLSITTEIVLAYLFHFALMGVVEHGSLLNGKIECLRMIHEVVMQFSLMVQGLRVAWKLYITVVVGSRYITTVSS